MAWWLWPNLLGLDASVVALVWQDFVARVFPSALHLPGRLVLGLTVWAIYLADRLIDSRGGAGHVVFRRNRRTLFALLGLVLFTDFAVAFLRLRFSVLEFGILPFAAVVIYLVIFVIGAANARWAKKFCAAALFTAGVFTVAWSGQMVLPWAAAGFFALCFANLVLVDSDAGFRGIWILPFVFGVAGTPWFWAVGLSAAGLGAVELLGTRGVRRRVFADLVLLTPLLFWR